MKCRSVRSISVRDIEYGREDVDRLQTIPIARMGSRAREHGRAAVATFPLVVAPPVGEGPRRPHYICAVSGVVDSMMPTWRPLLVKH